MREMIPGHVVSNVVKRPLPPMPELFGVRSLTRLGADMAEILRGLPTGDRFQLDPTSLGLIRPELAFPAYLGLVPETRLAPVFNLFDRTHGGTRYSQRVTRKWQRDFRGGRLTYDDHTGTDFVCPPGTPLVAAAPGVVAAIRDRWLRGGPTVSIDHGLGVVTQYTHCWKTLVSPGQILERGEPVALAGSAGIDMAGFFPWVPPHIHFTVFVNGRASDPYRAEDEEDGPGTWLDRNAPRPSEPLYDDPTEPVASPVDEEALERAAAACTDARIQQEIATLRDDPVGLAAVLEDAMLFDEWAWPGELFGTPLRPRSEPGVDGQPERVALTLPLPAEQYDGAFFADTPLTAPRP